MSVQLPTVNLFYSDATSRDMRKENEVWSIFTATYAKDRGKAIPSSNEDDSLKSLKERQATIEREKAIPIFSSRVSEYEGYSLETLKEKKATIEKVKSTVENLAYTKHYSTYIHNGLDLDTQKIPADEKNRVLAQNRSNFTRYQERIRVDITNIESVVDHFIAEKQAEAAAIAEANGTCCKRSITKFVVVAIIAGVLGIAAIAAAILLFPGTLIIAPALFGFAALCLVFAMGSTAIALIAHRSNRAIQEAH